MPRERCVHIIDDEAKVRDALTLLLSTAQIESRCYASAEEYLASVPLKEPACILLDNQLPGMSGIELLKRITGTASNSAVIMITGYGDVPTAVSAMKVGAFHFVEKPFDAEALLITVEEALSRADEGRDVQQEIAEIKARSALLTQREREVLALLLEGLPTKLIARQLGISARTIEHHRAAVMQKMQARNISHLVRMTLSIGHFNNADNKVGSFPHSKNTPERYSQLNHRKAEILRSAWVGEWEEVSVTKNCWAYFTAIFVALSAAFPCRAEADLKLPRESVTLVAPLFVHPHEQATKSGPEIIEFKLTVVEKPIVIDDAGTTIPGMTYNGSIPGPLMVVHEGDYVEVTLINPPPNKTTRLSRLLTIPRMAEFGTPGFTPLARHRPNTCWAKVNESKFHDHG